MYGGVRIGNLITLDRLLEQLLLDSDYRPEPGVLEYLTSMVLVYSGR